MKEQRRQAALVQRASKGDIDAFNRLVREYQDMAVGYALSLLGDFHEAEDAAQEAFVTLFRQFRELRDPVAFPAWFRSIVRTACTRSRRVQRLETVQLREELSWESPTRESDSDWSQDEMSAALRSLPETERSVITLFFMSGYSYREVALFLGIPETTVQGRMRSGRKRLKERMIRMAEADLRNRAPSRDSRFADRIKRLVRPAELKSEEELPFGGGRGTDIWEMLTAAIRGDLATIEQLVKTNPRLVECSHQYRTPLHFAVQENHIAVVKLLLRHGADATYRSGNIWHTPAFTIAEERGYDDMHKLLQDHLAQNAGLIEGGERIAAAIRERDVNGVRGMLVEEPDLIDAADGRGNKPIHWAAMTRSLPMIDLVLEKGGDVNSMRPDGARPVSVTGGEYFYRRRDQSPRAMNANDLITGYLIARGAHYTIDVATRVGDTDRVRELLERDSSLVNKVPDYSTYGHHLPLANACALDDRATIEVLLEYGADPTTPEPGLAPEGVALHMAAGNGNQEIARMMLERGANPNAPVESSGTSMMSASDYPEVLRLLASYGGEFRKYQDLTQIAPEGLEAVYGNALPLSYYVHAADLETLIARLDEDPNIVGEMLQMVFAKQTLPSKPVIRLCLDRDPSSARLIHANELIYNMHRYGGEEAIIDVVKWLLDAGMTPNDSDWLRVTSLHRLAMGSIPHGSDGTAYTMYMETMKLFIEAGADLDAKDEEYQSTPLGWASRWGRQEAVQLLLEKGAKTNLPDDLPWATPLAWATCKGHVEVVELLKQHGVTI